MSPQMFLRLSAIVLALLLGVTNVNAYTPTSAPPATDQLLQTQASTSSQPFAGDLWKRTELYFGSEKPDGSVVTEREFQQFVDAQVTPHFPDGLTLLAGYGQFRNAAGQIVKERSHVLILLYPMQTGDANMAVEAIRTAYKDAFQQESVLRIDSLSLVSF